MSASTAIAESATTSLWLAGSLRDFTTYRSSTPRAHAAPHARFATRLFDFATSRHKYCGLGTFAKMILQSLDYRYRSLNRTDPVRSEGFATDHSYAT